MAIHQVGHLVYVQSTDNLPVELESVQGYFNRKTASG